MARRPLPSLRKVVTEDLETLERVGCQFFMCKGPDKRPVSMQTCHVCWRIWQLRRLLQRLTEGT